MASTPREPPEQVASRPRRPKVLIEAGGGEVQYGVGCDGGGGSPGSGAEELGG